MYYDSLIRKMSTIIFLILRFLKKKGKSEHSCSITSPCYFYGIFMVGAALCTADFFLEFSSCYLEELAEEALDLTKYFCSLPSRLAFGSNGLIGGMMAFNSKPPSGT